MDWFERAWEQREEHIYRDLFGEAQPKIRVLTFELFRDRFKQESVDPRWLHHGVLVFPPNDCAPHFRYVTSGLSNAWEDEQPDPQGMSGFGVEYIFATMTFNEWAMGVTLNMLAFQLLLAAGRFGEPALIGPYDRVPLNSPIDGKQSLLTHILFTDAVGLEQEQYVESGYFRLMQLVGITHAEAAYARAHGGAALVSLMQEHASYPLTNPARPSLV